VLTTDAKGFKVFTRYDILSRPVVTGKYKGTASPAGTNPLFETPNTTAPHYYTSTSFPTDNNLDVYKVFYYDDYDIDNNGSLSGTETYTNPAESGYETAAFLRTRGKPTASKTGILKNDGTAPTVFLTTRTYYDKEYSVIQVNKQNHLSEADITSSAYDFANRVTKTRRDHTGTPPGGSQKTYYIREEYTYDEAGRLRFTRHNVKTTAGVPTSGWVVTAAPVYDELNRVADKRLHASNYDGISVVGLGASFNYLQSLDYAYNIRGWLTGINAPTTCVKHTDDYIADLFNMALEYETSANGGTAQYNGNISTIQWNTNINGTCSTRNLYRFSYDYANRLTGATYRARVGTSWVDQSKYTEGSITYDLNGNLKTYLRRGHTTGSMIDNLTYTYGDAARPDRLTNVVDAADATKGFKYTTGAADYQYDLNGNLTQDNHKTFTYGYNYLNLPQSMTKGADVITMTYTADGEKLTKALTGGGATKSYVSGIEYSGTNLEAIYFSDGRCTPNGSSAFYYEYSVKDHLGNARVSFRANGSSLTPLQENHYYPFGLEMEGPWIAQVGTENQYQYNSKELNEDFGLNLCDYGARWYDAALGRWWSVDPMAEDIEQAPFSPYHYTFDNPISYIDPDGMKGTNEYVRDSETGETVLVGNKGGDETDYVYTGTITKDKEGYVTQVAYSTYGAKELKVDHRIEVGTGFAGMITREPGLMVRHFAGNQVAQPFDDPFIGAGPSLLKGAVSLTGSLISSLARSEARVGVGAVVSGGANAARGGSGLVTQYPAVAEVAGTMERTFLMPGQVIDRYGSLGGKWFSTPGTSYGARSIPPNLTPYTQFKVLKPFEVQKSLAAPGMLNIQTGFGVQFKSPIGANILIKRGIIEPWKP
jgi:RHS repeat-associated protein